PTHDSCSLLALSERSLFIRPSTLRRRGIAGFRRGIGERVHVGLRIVVNDDGRLLFVRHARLYDAGHSFQAFLDDARAGGPVHVLHRKRNCLLAGERNRWRDKAEAKRQTCEQSCHWAISMFMSKESGMKLRPSAITTSAVAKTSPPKTILFGIGRTQTSPSRQGPVRERYT